MPNSDKHSALQLGELRRRAGTAVRRSGDEKMDRLFRMMPEATEGNGFTVSDRSDGRLCTASIVGALATIRAATAHNVAIMKRKMVNGERGQQ
jgi:hypothetical protein